MIRRGLAKTPDPLGRRNAHSNTAAAGLDAVPDDAKPAVIARRRQSMDRALEGIVGPRTRPGISTVIEAS
jgi:hypothetical protein